MLDFHLGTGGIDNPGEHLGGLSSEDVYWLQKNEFIKQGLTGHCPDDSPESFPVGDDVILSHKQVMVVFKKFSSRLQAVKSTPGFDSKAVSTLEMILSNAVNAKRGMSTIAD